MTTYQETQESLGTLLEYAAQEGTIRVQRPNGQVFVLQPAAEQKSPSMCRALTCISMPNR